MSELINPKVWAAIVAAALLAFCLAFSYRAGKANVRADFDGYKIAQSEARILADRAQRTEETRRQVAIDQKAQDAQAEIAGLESDLRLASGAADGLRNAAADAARRPGKSSCASSAGKGQSDSETLDLLAQLLGRSGERTAELGALADRLRIAGATCEASYDALRSAAR